MEPPYTLQGFGFANGSLFTQIQELLPLYPTASTDPGANITFLPDGKVQLRFDDTGQNLAFSLSLLTALIAKDQLQIVISCMYPLSGQYDHLPRALFYLCIVVAVIGRHRYWVAKTALGIVMSYSATACIHLFILLGFYDFGFPSYAAQGFPQDQKPNAIDSRAYGDPDFWGIAPVVAITAICLIPMLHWSNSFHSNRARPLIVYWAMLIFVAFVLVCILAIGWQTSWTINAIPSFAICNKTCVPAIQNDGSSRSYPVVLSLEQYNSPRCNCVDFCSSLNPTAPLRRNTGMVPLLSHKFAISAACDDPGCNVGSKPAYDFQETVFGLWFASLSLNTVALLSAWSNPEAVRNLIFRGCNADFRDLLIYVFKKRRQETVLNYFGLEQPASRKGAYRWIRRGIARSIAASYYLLSLAGLFICPILFILSIVIGELFLGTITTSERSDAVGAWGPWVAAAFVVVSAGIVHFHASVVRQLASHCYRALRLIQYSPDERLEKAESQDTLNRPFRKSVVGVSGHHILFLLKRMFWAWEIKARAFWAWWKDPERLSMKQVLQGQVSVLTGKGATQAFQGFQGKTWIRQPQCQRPRCGKGEDVKKSDAEESGIVKRSEPESRPLMHEGNGAVDSS